MKGTRLVVGSALAVAIAVVVIALSLPLDSWSRALAIAVAVMAGACGIALTALMATTMFIKTGDEMWNTGYFRYMRAVWGKCWGGDKDLLQISVCRANWLGVLTIAGWFLAVAVLATPILFNVWAVMNGIQTIGGEESSFGRNFPGLIFMSLVYPFFSFLVFYFIFPRVRKDNSRDREIFVLSAMVIYGILLISVLIVAPIRSVGLVSYLIGAAWFFGIIAAFAAVVGIVVSIFRLGMRTFKNLSHKTVPGHLVKMQRTGWKNNICPIIIGKQK
ncbi:MAG: hypothetical protein Q7R84_02470 [bacterium]|nr:hypothetical protein [bacterium]